LPVSFFRNCRPPCRSTLRLQGTLRMLSEVDY
jgi:hypothetical protein